MTRLSSGPDRFLTRPKVARATGFVLVLPLAALLLAPGPAAALSTGAGVSAQIVETYCDGDCAGFLDVARPGGTPFAFELAGKVVFDGLDLRVETPGSVYLVGPITSETSILLQAGLDLTARGNVQIAAGGNIEIEVPSSGGEGGDLVIDATLPPFGVLPPRLDNLCGCIDSLLGSDISLVSGLVALTEQDVDFDLDSDFGLQIGFGLSRDGDIFLDLSGVELFAFEVVAGRSIVIVGGDLSSIPEPGSALLLGLGLAALARRFSTTARS